MLSLTRITVQKAYDECVKLAVEYPQDMRDALTRKPYPAQVNKFLERLSHEMQKAIDINAKRGVFVKPKNVEDTVHDMTKIFMKGFHNIAERRIENEHQRLAREAAQGLEQEYENVLSGKPTGDFLDAGVITNEKIDKQREVGGEEATTKNPTQA